MSRRLTALVIGNAAYEHACELRNPANDAEDIAANLQACGFSVIKKIDCSTRAMDRALKGFKRNLADNDVGLFFFAGHRMQIDDDLHRGQSAKNVNCYCHLPLGFARPSWPTAAAMFRHGMTGWH